MACSNCSADFDSTKEGLLVTQKLAIVTSICGACLEGGRIVKLVLRRGDVGNFTYEQYSTLEMMGGGLTSPKRAKG